MVDINASDAKTLAQSFLNDVPQAVKDLLSSRIHQEAAKGEFKLYFPQPSAGVVSWLNQQGFKTESNVPTGNGNFDVLISWE